MTIKYVSNGIMVATLLAAAAAVPVYASEFDLESHRQSNRPPINPDFAPDRSCMFDAYQLKCIPGSEQSCHEVGFGNNEDATRFLKHPNGCPEGYCSADDDETGQCY